MSDQAQLICYSHTKKSISGGDSGLVKLVEMTNFFSQQLARLANKYIKHCFFSDS